jgi:hypothetical protein
MHSVVISQGKKNRKRNFLSQTNLLRRGLHLALEKLKQPKAGFPAFRLSGFPAFRLSGFPAFRLSGFPAFRLSADTGLHGSERIASMLRLGKSCRLYASCARLRSNEAWGGV